MTDELITIEGQPFHLSVQPGLFLVRFSFAPAADGDGQGSANFRVDIFREFGRKNESRQDLLPPLKDHSNRGLRAYAMARVKDFLAGYEIFWTREPSDPLLHIFTYGESDVS